MKSLSKIRPRYSERVSENVSIEIYGGWNEIGGNCVKVTDKGLGRSTIFDQGIRFSLYSRYYSSMIQPRGLYELRSLGIIPDPQIFTDADDIYISHMHLDHLGVLSNIDKRNVRLFLPSLELHERIKEGAWQYGEWKHLLLPARPFVKVFSSAEAKDPVIARHVSHSAFPAYSYLYFGSDATVLYTGDLREISSDNILNKENIFSFLENNPDIRVDVLVLEGTNIGKKHTPITIEEWKRILARYIEAFKGGPILVNVDERDLETIVLILNAVRKEREVWILDSKLAVVIDAFLKEFPNLQHYFDHVLLLNELFSNVRSIPSFWANRLVSLEDMEYDNQVFLIGKNIVEALKDIRSFGVNLEGSLIILSDSEPLTEEFVMEARRIETWLNIFNMVPIRLRINGHYYPHIFREILELVKPRKLIPIHTKAPNTMLALFSKLN